MKSITLLIDLVAVLPAVYGIAFEGPVPTANLPDRAIVGFTPKPTEGPSLEEFRKRQANSNAETCGWVDGDFAFGVTCSVGRTCKLYKSGSPGMAGCCRSGDDQNCGWANTCINYSRYVSDCGSDCLLNSFIRKCNNPLSPYCITYTYPGDRVADYGCATGSSNTVYTVLQSATDGVGGTTKMTLPTVAAGAVITTYRPSSYTGTTYATTRKKVAVSLIVGLVIAGLFVLFVIGIVIFIIMKKRKKNRQLAANAQIVAAAQASRPQSQFPPPMQQAPPLQNMPPPGGFVPPMPPQSPAPGPNGYFAQPGQQDNKFNNHASVQEFPVTPISNPGTPAPQYANPVVSPIVPPMPSRPVSQYHPPMNGAFEADSTGMPPPPQQQQQWATPAAHEVAAVSMPHAPNNQGPVYEIGQGR